MKNILLTELQTADLLGLKPATLRHWRWVGDGPAYIKLGRSVRYDTVVIEQFIEAGRRNSTSDNGIRY